MSEKRGNSQKKRLYSLSYLQSFKNGDLLQAYSQVYERVLTKNGVYIEDLKGRLLLIKESKVFYT